MGEVRVYELDSKKLIAQWTTPDFTSWGIIKSHCYIGGIYDMQFSPDDDHIYVAGMGYMRDPMAGNGKQLWQHVDSFVFPGEEDEFDVPSTASEYVFITSDNHIASVVDLGFGIGLQILEHK